MNLPTYTNTDASTSTSTDTNVTLDQFSQLIEALYQGPLETIPWQKFLGLLRTQLQADGAVLILRHPSETDLGAIVTEGFPELNIGRDNVYSQNLYSMDPFVNLPPGKVVTLEETVATETLMKSEFYRLTLAPAGIFHLMGADIREREGLKASLRISRGKNKTRFSPQEKNLCSILLPHLKQAIHLHAKINYIESERSLYASTVGQMSVASILLDENRQVLKTNAIAKQLLAEKDGICMREGCLYIDRSQDNTRFKTLVTEALSAQHQAQPALVQALPIERRNGRPALGLIVRPIPVNEWAEEQSTPTVAIFISDPEQKTEVSQQILAQLFSLTPAEARLAMLLANGLNLDDAVAQLDISRNTGRAHLRSIFSKTGVSQQTQLVSLILKSVASLGS